jgi:tetratricopeptide (TPR) repeat protein
MQDHYETLQVHPRADAEAIEAAYARLRERYDPARLEGAADELVELARDRRDAIERAYTILSDPERRAAYDREQAERSEASRSRSEVTRTAVAPADDELIDYRPLPPARRQERSREFNAQPYLAAPPSETPVRGRRAASGQPAWIMPALLVGVATFGIVLATLVSTVMSTPSEAPAADGPNILDAGQPTAAAPTASVEQIINQFEGQVIAARQVANQVPENPNAWIELGHALYDSTIVIRERLAGGDQAFQNAYIERLPRWLEAGEAYRQALVLQPENATVRADLAASLCYYGKDANAQEYIVEGLSEAEQALAAAPEDGRALLSMGLCLVFSEPPQTELAMQQWQKAVILTDVEPGVVVQARQLIAEYSLGPGP